MPAVDRRWTRDEVLRLIEQHPDPTPRYELVDGVLLVGPSPSRVHQRAVGELFYALTTYLRAHPTVGEAFVSPSDTEPEQGVIVQPDVFVLPRHEAQSIHGWPARQLLLAAEVLSPRDPSGDRTRKRALYQRTVPEYWIVDPDAREIQVWTLKSIESRSEQARLEWHPSGATEPFVLDVRAFFARVHGEAF